MSTAIGPFDVKPLWSYDNGTWGGFLPRAYDMIAQEMGLSIPLVAASYSNTGGFKGWFGPLVEGLVDSQHGMGSETWSYNSTMLYTAPFVDSPIRGLISVSKQSMGYFVWIQVCSQR